MAPTEIPQEFGFLFMNVAFGFFSCMWQANRLVVLRPKVGVPYPEMFATISPSDEKGESTDPKAQEKFIFNCVQRCHGNMLENLPIAMGAMLITGLKYPIFAAYCGAVWNVARVVYAIGYPLTYFKQGNGRLLGSSIGLFTQVLLLGGAAKASYDIAFA